jgi:hypothetical protein
MLGRVLHGWVIFVCLSGIAEAAFILFAGDYFQGASQTLSLIFPNSTLAAAISRTLSPILANETLTLTIWTLTSMAISLEIVFVPLLALRKNEFAY